AALTSTAYAQDEQAPPSVAPSAPDDLSKQLNNPVSSLISVPFQENIDFSVGPDEGTRSVLNVQPVVPFAISKEWNLIVRTIMPVTYQDDVVPDSNQFGLGDVTQSFFFSPSKSGPGGITWALGPVFVYPTATDRYLGGDKWGAGPTAILLKQSGGNTFGILANHVWSVAGNDDRADISTTFLQPFFSHTTRSQTTIGLNTESTYDWKGKHWTVPVNLTVTQLTHTGKQPVSVGGGVRYYASAPRDGPNWGVRLIFTMLFPKK
ncbi:MAG TPA: hypothetical protein VFH89_00820, partial [Sphingomicrobium sp.]|nr:hypothetical protein [Sphingomicrobium sp.]